jgi:hypothetical protein
MTKNEIKVLGFYYDKKDKCYFRKDDLYNDSSYWSKDTLEKMNVLDFLKELRKEGEKEATKFFKQQIRDFLCL